MKKMYYHATSTENLKSILRVGIHRGCDGVVYLTERPEEAARFVAIRGCKEIVVIGMELEQSLIRESFDHDEKFFGCRGYMYSKDISPDELISFVKYENPFF